jgi:hypothetical protein
MRYYMAQHCERNKTAQQNSATKQRNINSMLM